MTEGMKNCSCPSKQGGERQNHATLCLFKWMSWHQQWAVRDETDWREMSGKISGLTNSFSLPENSLIVPSLTLILQVNISSPGFAYKAVQDWRFPWFFFSNWHDDWRPTFTPFHIYTPFLSRQVRHPFPTFSAQRQVLCHVLNALRCNSRERQEEQETFCSREEATRKHFRHNKPETPPQKDDNE